jgi:Helix-loop-helix DNA-binding domain
MMGGFGMGMNSLDGSMGMMGGIGMANGGLSLGLFRFFLSPTFVPFVPDFASLTPLLPLGSLQSPSLQTSSLSTNNNTALSTSPSSQPLLTSSSTGSSSPHSATTIITNHQDKQSILANEKRRRRRESHNAVERRRRDNINEKISELATLIPECMLEGGGSGHGNGGKRSFLFFFVVYREVDRFFSFVGSSPPHLTPTSPGAGGMAFLDGSDPLLPSSYGLTNAHGNGSSSPIGIKEECTGAEEGGGVVKANKGMILRKSVDYIRYDLFFEGGFGRVSFCQTQLTLLLFKISPTTSNSSRRT